MRGRIWCEGGLERASTENVAGEYGKPLSGPKNLLDGSCDA